MSLLVNYGSSPVHSGAVELEARLWEMDPRLQSSTSTREHPKEAPPNGDPIIGRRYEVWRHCEDEKNRMIGHWRMEESTPIYSDMVVMAAGAAGRITGVEDRIDAHNDEPGA